MAKKTLLQAAAAEYKFVENKESFRNRPQRDALKEQAELSTKRMRRHNYALYLQSDEWHEKRAEVLERDDYTCVFCQAEAEHVHHLTYDRIYNESSYDLVSLCAECHEAIHLLDKR